MKSFAVAVLAALAGAVALWALAWPDEIVRYERVEVPVEVIVEREPDTIVRIVERLKIVTPDPVQIATAPGGGILDVAKFCAPTILIAANDTTTERPAASLLLRSVVHEPGWWFKRDRLFVSGPTSFGDLVAADYRVRPGFSVRTSGDSVVVRYPRFGVVRSGVEVGVPLVLGLIVGALVW